MDVDYSTSKKLSIDTLVLSCDRYSDLWDGFFYQFNKYYPRDKKVYFGANELSPTNTYGHNILLVHSGVDYGWEDSFRKILEQINSEYLLITLEDLYLSGPTNTEIIQEIENFIEAGFTINHVKCTNTIKGLNPIGNHLMEIDVGVPYRVTLCGIWNRKYLLGLLERGESPWQFEINGSYRSRNQAGFYATRTSILSNVNMVEKGYWIKSSLKWAIDHKIPINPLSRATKTSRQEFISLMKDSYFNLVMKIPVKFRKRVYLLVKKLLIIH